MVGAECETIVFRVGVVLFSPIPLLVETTNRDVWSDEKGTLGTRRNCQPGLDRDVFPLLRYRRSPPLIKIRQYLLQKREITVSWHNNNIQIAKERFRHTNESPMFYLCLSKDQPTVIVENLFPLFLPTVWSVQGVVGSTPSRKGWTGERDGVRPPSGPVREDGIYNRSTYVKTRESVDWVFQMTFRVYPRLWDLFVSYLFQF